MCECVFERDSRPSPPPPPRTLRPCVLREQLMFPLQFVGVLGRFDLECSVGGGGRSSQAGALRLAVSRALLSFLSEGEVEALRQGGRGFSWWCKRVMMCLIWSAHSRDAERGQSLGGRVHVCARVLHDCPVSSGTPS